MIISVASGKGGTGKTTVAVNLALSLKNVQLLDCDVEEPNAHLFLKPEIHFKKVATIPVPVVDESKCNYCGRCRDICAYGAIAVIPQDKDMKGSVMIFPHLCHSCGGCSLLCPQDAIKEASKEIGIIEVGSCGGIQFVHGKLNIGEIMSPPLIKQVKEYINPACIVIIDAPPGTSCPVIASVKGSDFCILVTEPTPFGLNDMVLAVEVLAKLQIPHGVVVNRSDIGDNKVDLFCQENKIPILMRIPFDKDIALLYSKGISIVEEKKEYVKRFQDMFNLIISTIPETGKEIKSMSMREM
jgi:MinD superfamily P-loop ATPase